MKRGLLIVLVLVLVATAMPLRSVADTDTYTVHFSIKKFERLEEEFRRWAFNQYLQYLSFDEPPYYSIGRAKVQFDQQWYEDKKSGSTNRDKNPNYEQETKNFYMFVIASILKTEVEQVSLSVKDYAPGMIYNMTTKTWEEDINGRYLKDSMALKVEAQLNELNAKLLDDAIKLEADILFMLAGQTESTVYKWKNRGVDAIRDTIIQVGKIENDNERKILSNAYRDQLIIELTTSLENINDDILSTLDKQKAYLDKKQNRSQDEELEKCVLEQAIEACKLSKEKINDSITTTKVKYGGKEVSLDEALRMIAEEAITNLGNEKEIIKSEEELKHLKQIVFYKEACKALLKGIIIDSKLYNGKNLSDHFRDDCLTRWHLGVRFAGSAIGTVGIEALIDAVVELIFDMVYDLEKASEPNCLDLLKSYILEILDSANGYENDSIGIYEEFRAVIDQINKKWNEKIGDFERYSDPGKSWDYINIADTQRREALAKAKNEYLLRQAQNKYDSSVSEKVFLGSDKYSNKYLEVLRQNGGFVGAFISDALTGILDSFSGVFGFDWSEFGDLFDDDPNYSSLANQTYRIKQLAEQADGLLRKRDTVDFYLYSGDIDDLAEEINTMRTIMIYHVNGNLLYATLAVANELEQDPQHAEEVYQEYMYWLDELKKTEQYTRFGDLNVLWEVPYYIAAIGDAYSKSEFLKFIKSRLVSVKESEQIVNDTVALCDSFIIPTKYSPLFQKNP